MDRSAAYAARWVAKSLVKAELCRRVLVQVSGSANPPVFFSESGAARSSYLRFSVPFFKLYVCALY